MDSPIDGRFAEFFRALWGFPPFAWQQALAERVLTNLDAPWPQAIALPTAAGKTACIDIAVFALAAQADRLELGEAITAPRRIFFVVDRRVIVDEAFERARRLAAKLAKPTESILQVVADRLRRLAAGPDETKLLGRNALEVFELRGGTYRSEAWARSPLQPMVVASTVDQFGSRLLFRAYGRGPGMWPVYAALTGNDSLILLDEAHCARPFLETLRAVARYRTWAEEPLPSPFQPVVLSATPPEEARSDCFRDQSGEGSDPDHPLGRRQLARKPARLVLTKASGKNANLTLAKGLTKHATELAEGPRKAIVVFANRVATARNTHRLLSEHCRRHGGQCLLITGRMRPLDRDRLLDEERVRALHSANSTSRKLLEPIYVVATQTLEVGADLDFDALVTECASLDALRQRFGRLNRMGRAIAGENEDRRAIGAEGVILVRADQCDAGSDDPVYGTAIGNTWQALVRSAGESGSVDFSIADLDPETLAEGADGPLLAPAPHAPVLLPSHLDAWVQTSPEPAPVPEPALFLHGTERGAPDIRVCWRADMSLDSEEDIDAAIDTLTLCPPAASECLPVPIYVMRRWLTGDTLDDSTDVEGPSGADTATSAQSNGTPAKVMRWLGRDAAGTLTTAEDLRPGDVVVIPSGTGDPTTLGDFPDGAPEANALDRGDEAYLRSRAKAMLRLHPALVSTWPVNQDTRSEIADLVNQAGGRFEDEPDALVGDLMRLLDRLASLPDWEPEWTWLRDAAAHFAARGERRLRRLVVRHPAQGIILRGRDPLKGYMGEAETFSDEDDASASGTGRPVPLLPPATNGGNLERGHLHGVARFARHFAEGCQLGPSLVDAVERAGRLHDIGKADHRFQALLHGGNPWVGGPLLAKSADIPQGAVAYQTARQAAGYPKGGRHELLSVRLAESGGDAVLPREGDPRRGLVLHLVASHHGRCRPFAPIIEDPSAPSVSMTLDGVELVYTGPTGLERVDSGVAERFWTQVRRYGWWGSAWLEAILRLADHRRSEWEEQQ